MNFLISFMVVVLVGTAVAYDFKDSMYNQILKGDLEDNYDTLGGFYNHRVTREVMDSKDDDKKCKRDRWHKGACCSDADDIKAHTEQMKELKKQCFAEIRGANNQGAPAGEEQPPMDVFSCDRVNKTKSEIVCVLECVAKKQSIADDKGDLKVPELTKYVKDELLSAEWQRAIADKTIEKCSQEARMEAEKPRAATACNPSAIKFGHCVWREIQLACPADKIQDAQKCQRFREKAAKKDAGADGPAMV